jgi:hypothetical protein
MLLLFLLPFRMNSVPCYTRILEAAHATALNFLMSIKAHTNCIAAVYIAGLDSDNTVKTIE